MLLLYINRLSFYQGLPDIPAFQKYVQLRMEIQQKTLQYLFVREYCYSRSYTKVSLDEYYYIDKETLFVCCGAE